MYNQPKPYSVFSEVPTTPQSSDALFSTVVDDTQPQSGHVQLFQQQVEKGAVSNIGDMTPSPITNGERGQQQQQQTSSALAQPYADQHQRSLSLQHKRSYSEVDDHHSTRVFDLSATVPVSSLSLSETPAHLTATPTNTIAGKRMIFHLNILKY